MNNRLSTDELRAKFVISKKGPNHYTVMATQEFLKPYSIAFQAMTKKGFFIGHLLIVVIQTLKILLNTLCSNLILLLRMSKNY